MGEHDKYIAALESRINEYAARIAELEAERHYLAWFHMTADFGPANTDVVMAMQSEYAKRQPVPKEWAYEQAASRRTG